MHAVHACKEVISMSDPTVIQAQKTKTTTLQTGQMMEQQQVAAQPLHLDALDQTTKKPSWTSSVKKNSLFDKPKSESVYTLPQSEVHHNYSDERLDAFQENLSYNITLDLSIAQNKLANSPVGPACMDALHAIQQYAALPLRKTKRAVQAAALNNARKKIAEFIASHKEKSDVADEMMNRYQVYFSTFCDGNLFERDKGTMLRIDATGEQDTPELKQLKDRKVKYADRREDPLFAHEPSMNDIAQNQLGDCYLQAGVSSLIMNNPTAIKECMQDNGDGTVTVRFFQRFHDMSNESQVQLDHPARSDLWSAKASKDMSDKDLIFKLLQNSECPNILQTISEPGTTASIALDNYLEKQLETKMREKGLADDPGKLMMLKGFYFASFQDTMGKAEIYQKGANVEQTLLLADKLVQNKEIQDQVVSYMRTCMNNPDMDLQEIYTECLIRLYAHFPIVTAFEQEFKDLELSSLDTSELRTLLDKQQTDSKKMQEETADRFVPMYVTVTKEVPVIRKDKTGEEEDAYTKESLWMQLLEKAYAASGLHGNELSEEARQKIKEKVDLHKKELEAGGMSGDELQRNLNEYEKLLLRKWAHSFEGIVGGHSGSFLEKLTGKKNTTTDFKLMDAQAFTTAFDTNTFQEQIRQTTNIDIPISDIMKDLSDFLTKKHATTYGTKSYFTQPLYIEDIEDAMQDFSSKNTWLNQRTLTAIRKTCSDNGIKLKELSDKVKKCMRDTLHNNDKYNLLHRPMSGAYTPYAETTFEQIKQNLKNKVPVSVGTIKFLPEGVQAIGRNGESEQSGLYEQHAYSVVGTVEQDGKYFVQLRNPWSTGEMGYVQTRHSDGSTSYSSHRNDSDKSGIFNIELNHLLSRISRINFSG